MSYRISILDKSPLAAGETAAQALARTLTLAQHAEAWAITASGSPNTTIPISWRALAGAGYRLAAGPHPAHSSWVRRRHAPALQPL